MAVDPETRRLFVIFRNPSKLRAFRTEDGKPAADVDSCGDADDVFVDPRSRRLYVSCGEGAIDVFAMTSQRYDRIARIPTIAGARTSLFDPTADRLYLGVRATATEPPAIWVYRPEPRSGEIIR